MEDQQEGKEMEMENKDHEDSTTPALVDHVYGTGQQLQRPVVIRTRKEDQFKWTEEETRQFLELRRKYISNFYSGRRGCIQKTYAVILEEMGLQRQVTPSQARKKWNNMVQLYRRLVNQPRFDAGDGKEFVPMISWPFFRDVEQTMELEPQQVEAPECQTFEGTSLEDLSEQINSRIIQVRFTPANAGGDNSEEAPPRKRTKREKRESLLAMIDELTQLNKKQEEILAAKNNLTIKLLNQLV